MSFHVPLLPENYTVGPNDVIIGRGKRCTMNPGNLRFKAIIKDTLESYQNAETKVMKSDIIMQVLTDIRAGNGAGFVKVDPSSGRFVQVEEASSRIAIAQAFRDALSGTYKSSKKHKQMRRLERKRASATAFVSAHFVEDREKEVQSEPISIFDEASPVPSFAPAPPKSPANNSCSSGISMLQLRGLIEQASRIVNLDRDQAHFAQYSSQVVGPFPCPPSAFCPPRAPPANSDISVLLMTLQNQQASQADNFEPTPFAFKQENGYRAV